MASYLQLERTGDGVIESNAPVVFDNIISSEGDRFSYSDVTGEITVSEPGFYYIDWFVTPQFGLTGDGSNFAVVMGSDIEAMGSSHVRVSQTVGFAVVDVNAPDTTLRLVNASDNSLTLSQIVITKASFAIFSVDSGGTVLE